MEFRELVRFRGFRVNIVRERTRLKNRVHAHHLQNNISIDAGPSPKDSSSDIRAWCPRLTRPGEDVARPYHEDMEQRPPEVGSEPVHQGPHESGARGTVAQFCQRIARKKRVPEGDSRCIDEATEDRLLGPQREGGHITVERVGLRQFL
jgi:hypothetical protein